MTDLAPQVTTQSFVTHQALQRLTAAAAAEIEDLPGVTRLYVALDDLVDDPRELGDNTFLIASVAAEMGRLAPLIWPNS